MLEREDKTLPSINLQSRNSQPSATRKKRSVKKLMVDRLKISNVNSYSSFSLLRLVFWKSIHLEVASDSFCFLINSSWLLVFILYVFFMIFSGFNLFCWKWIHFSYNNFIIFGFLQIGLIFSLHFWLSSFFCLFLSFISFFLKVS